MLLSAVSVAVMDCSVAVVAVFRTTLLKVEKRNYSSVMFTAIQPDDPVGRAILEFHRAHDKK